MRVRAGRPPIEGENPGAGWKARTTSNKEDRHADLQATRPGTDGEGEGPAGDRAGGAGVREVPVLRAAQAGRALPLPEAVGGRGRAHRRDAGEDGRVSEGRGGRRPDR